MFSAQDNENDQAESMKFTRDIATYINKRGGKQVVFGRIKMNGILDQHKVVMFIQKIKEAGEIDPNSEFAN